MHSKQIAKVRMSLSGGSPEECGPAGVYSSLSPSKQLNILIMWCMR